MEECSKISCSIDRAFGVLHGISSASDLFSSLNENLHSGFTSCFSNQIKNLWFECKLFMGGCSVQYSTVQIDNYGKHTQTMICLQLFNQCE